MTTPHPLSHTVLVKKKVAKHVNTSRRFARSVRSRYSRTNVREMRTTTVAVRMRIGIYTVRELRDTTVAMGLQFCLYEVVTKNHDQFATFFLTSTVHNMKAHTC